MPTSKFLRTLELGLLNFNSAGLGLIEFGLLASGLLEFDLLGLWELELMFIQHTAMLV